MLLTISQGTKLKKSEHQGSSMKQWHKAIGVSSALGVEHLSGGEDVRLYARAQRFVLKPKVFKCCSRDWQGQVRMTACVRQSWLHNPVLQGDDASSTTVMVAQSSIADE